jgi:hypothetical protein
MILEVDPMPTEEDAPSPDLSPYPGVPRWVKVFGIVAILLILSFAILHLTGNNFRGHMLQSNVTAPDTQQQ